MHLEIIYNASPVIKWHIIMALIAIFLGPFVLYGTKSRTRHRALGYTWVSAMSMTALSSFFIQEIPYFGAVSPIHLLSLALLWGLWGAVQYARRGDIKTHTIIVRRLYFSSLLIALAMNFIPGRLISETIFPHTPWLGFGLALGCIAMVIARGMIIRSLFRWFFSKNLKYRFTNL